MSITWVLERGVFSDNHDRLAQALSERNLNQVDWNDAWLDTNQFPCLDGECVVFHGCLANADFIAKKQFWNPGAYCNEKQFECSHWYPEAEQWLVQKDWSKTTVEHLVNDPESCLKSINRGHFFVRPNSPLKPFSGRVLHKDHISMAALDFGFYYDDPQSEVIISSIQSITSEWRYVVCNKEVIAGSSYTADNRQATDNGWQGEPLNLAKEIASHMRPPEDVYVLDICLSSDGLKLLELNPFSGADLYHCDRAAVVEAVSDVMVKSCQPY